MCEQFMALCGSAVAVVIVEDSAAFEDEADDIWDGNSADDTDSDGTSTVCLYCWLPTPATLCVKTTQNIRAAMLGVPTKYLVGFLLFFLSVCGNSLVLERNHGNGNM
eukprot:m.60416 g.60416  ORF g.60416 m.60416 type:complete len:107 (-) comp22833_c0_seq4:307-627(-)